ncbi:MAG: L-aspartate oxidase [Elusimicrobia bacterium]|nr:MAG: L-aspartate oxidase [Elusimicrobiota bacterium]KAF0156581.1 MAG: L-aspartate oxidase [Elusimicrobiota bacterium]
MKDFHSDFLVLGGGLAGLMLAEKLSRLGTVTVLVKRDTRTSSTGLAQGGIAAVTAADDSFERHADDTIKAGGGLCDREIVELTVREGPARVKELLELGVKFSRREGAFDLGLEGGHSARRVLHCGDYTGREIQEALLAACSRNKKVRIRERRPAIDFILAEKAHSCRPPSNRCLGVYALDEATGRVETFTAGQTFLASGGAGKVYRYTSNPDTATGDGMAMAWRAGLDLANMEFVQFHPTCLYHPQAKSFLISEAVRGEGGVLTLAGTGRRFMPKYHKAAELAPRDIVARAIDAELKRTGQDCAWLDISFKGGAFLKKRFPQIHARCLALGIDIAKSPIPVVPATHFFCGGVKVDKDGRTAMPGLYAAGETAYTGLHGANRLASNSLMEACVFAHRAAEAAAASAGDTMRHGVPVQPVPAWKYGDARPSDEAVIISHNWDEIRMLMWNYVGIVRSDKRLERARRRIDIISGEILRYYWDFLLTTDLLELRNIACLAGAIIDSASARKESRGLHFNIDYPETSDRFLRPTIVNRYGNKG